MTNQSRTHYEVLGVAPGATQSEIRAAYRSLAQRLHPDRLRSGSDAEMAALNAAHHALSDPGRRAIYDRSLGRPAPSSGGRVSGPSPGSAAPSPPLPPARIPWRLMAVLGVIGVAAVGISAAVAGDPQPAEPDGILRAGECIAFEPNGDAREVACTGEPSDVIVLSMVALDATCPTGTVGHRDRQGLGIACIVP